MPPVERQLPIFALARVVLFPGMRLPLHVFEERYKLLIGTCQVTEQPFGVCHIRTGPEIGGTAEPELTGCTARIVDIVRLPDGRMNVLAVGEHRFRLLEPPAVAPEGYLVGRAEVTADEDAAEGVPATLVDEVGAHFERYVEALAGALGAGAVAHLPRLSADAQALSFQVAAALRVSPRERQRLLEAESAAARLRRALALLRREGQVLRLMGSARGAEAAAGPFSLN